MSTSMAESEALREYDNNVVLKLCWEQSLNEAGNPLWEIYNLPVVLFNFPVKPEKRCKNPPLRAGDRVRVS